MAERLDTYERERGEKREERRGDGEGESMCVLVSERVNGSSSRRRPLFLAALLVRFCAPLLRT